MVPWKMHTSDSAIVPRRVSREMDDEDAAGCGQYDSFRQSAAALAASGAARPNAATTAAIMVSLSVLMCVPLFCGPAGMWFCAAAFPATGCIPSRRRPFYTSAMKGILSFGKNILPIYFRHGYCITRVTFLPPQNEKCCPFLGLFAFTSLLWYSLPR